MLAVIEFSLKSVKVMSLLHCDTFSICIEMELGFE